MNEFCLLNEWVNIVNKIGNKMSPVCIKQLMLYTSAYIGRKEGRKDPFCSSILDLVSGSAFRIEKVSGCHLFSQPLPCCWWDVPIASHAQSCTTKSSEMVKNNGLVSIYSMDYILKQRGVRRRGVFEHPKGSWGPIFLIKYFDALFAKMSVSTFTI